MNKNLLIMKGFPKDTLEASYEEWPLANRANFERSVDIIMEEPSTVYLHKDKGCFIDALIKKGEPVASFRAICFASFFAHTFAEGTFTVSSRILYIYNVGTELSNSTEYSDRVLHKLIQHNKVAGNTTIVVGDYYNSSTFTNKYSMSSQLMDTKLQVVR